MNFEKKNGDEGDGGCRRRVMVVMDGGDSAKKAMMWALTHVVNKGDILTLLCIMPHFDSYFSSYFSKREQKVSLFVCSLASVCKSCCPEVEVETLVIRGHKLATVLNQVNKLKISVLVLGQTKPSFLSCFMMNKKENFVEQCIEKAECLAMAVRKQSNSVGGYLVSSKCQRNFWLLA